MSSDDPKMFSKFVIPTKRTQFCLHSTYVFIPLRWINHLFLSSTHLKTSSKIQIRQKDDKHCNTLLQCTRLFILPKPCRSLSEYYYNAIQNVDCMENLIVWIGRKQSTTESERKLCFDFWLLLFFGTNNMVYWPWCKTTVRFC